MSLWDTFTSGVASLFGYGNDSDTYAANVSAQLRIMRETYTNPPTAEWVRFYDTFVRNYGPPAASEAEQYARARAQYNDGITNGIGTGFIEGVAEAPGIIAGAVGGAVTSFWGGMPAWIKWASYGALVLFTLSILTRFMENFGGKKGRHA